MDRAYPDNAFVEIALAYVMEKKPKGSLNAAGRLFVGGVRRDRKSPTSVTTIRRAENAMEACDTQFGSAFSTQATMAEEKGPKTARSAV